MKRSAIHAGLVVVAILGPMRSGSVARAESESRGRRVLVLSPHPDDVSARLAHELSGVALDPTVFVTKGCDGAEIQLLADAEQAMSVICLGETQLGVWVSEGDGLRLRERLPWGSSHPSASDPAIVQATEVVRARLALLPPEAAKPVPQTSEGAAPATMSPGILDASAPPKDAVTPAVAPPTGNTPRLILGSGLSSLLSPGYKPTWGVGFEAAVGVSRHASVVLNAVVPVSSAQFDDGTSSASAHTTEIGAGFQIPFSAPTARVIPRLGAGWGILHMHTQPVNVPSDGHSVGHEEDLITPYFYGDVALSLRLYGPVRLTAASSVLGTPARFHIRVNGVEEGAFGGVALLTQLRAEVQLP